MRASEFWITVADGTRLFGRRWLVATGAARAKALLIHGVGEHSGRYDHVARVINAAGIEVVSYDQRGFGRSEGARGNISRDLSLVDDAAQVFAMVAGESGPAEPPPYLIAHSMGGAIAAFAVTSGAILPRALVLSSPAIRPQLLRLGEAVLRLMRDTLPDYPLDSLIDPDDLTHDRAVVRAIVADPLMHTTVTPRLIISVVDQGAAALASAPALHLDTLVLVAGSDRIVRADVARRFAQSMPAGAATAYRYPRLFHELFNEIEPYRSRVLGDLRAWLERH